jgi:hypothetical protein
MRAFPLRAFAVVLLALVAGPVAAQAARPIESRTPMPGSLVDLESPRGENWMLRTGENGDLTFMRYGRGRETTEVATVVAFGIDAEADDAAFSRVVQNEIAIGRGDPNRFEVIEATLDEVTKGDARCVRSFDLIRDLAAQLGGGKTREMVLAVHGLHCRHPTKRELGLSFVFSVRSLKRQEDTTTADAQAFFDSIEMHAPREMPADEPGAD